MSRERLAEIIDEVDELKSTNAFEDVLSTMAMIQYGVVQERSPEPALNARLEEIIASIDSFNSTELMAYLRSSYVSRSVLPAWRPLLELACEHSRNRGEDPNKIFRGLH